MSTTPARPRVTWRALHGVLLVDKPVGPTSQAVLARARRLWRAEKGGHTGTLDPLASGLLPLCFGAATKFAQAALDADKRYLATLHLGVTRVGGDREGDVLRERPVDVDRTAIDAAVARFDGAIDQVPPMHSALQHEGRALYTLARQGIEVTRAPRRVTIHRIDVVAFEPPSLVLDVRCSKGTYIRTLAEDLGEALGCGAHLAALRRTATGAFHVDDALGLDAADPLDEQARDARLLPVDSLLADCPAVALHAEDATRFLTGLRRRIEHADAARVRVYGPDDRFLGLGRVNSNELIVERLLSPIEVDEAARQMARVPSKVPN